MEVLYSALSWGSPIGIGLFIFLMASGGGIFFWGVSHLPTKDKAKQGK